MIKIPDPQKPVPPLEKESLPKPPPHKENHDPLAEPSFFSPQGSKKKGAFILFLFLLLVGLLAFFFLPRSKESGKNDLEESRFLLNTLVHIRLYASDNQKALDQAFALIEREENRFNRYQEDSEIALLNAFPTGKPFLVSPETEELIALALRFAQLSQGRLDPSIGPLVDLWGIGSSTARIPTAQEITLAKARVDYRWISIDQQANTVTLEKPSMSLDLGALAKGWIADRVMESLHAAGIEDVLLNFGGNVLVSGTKPGGEDFRIGIQDPFAKRGVYLGVFSVKNQSLVSSGTYENYFEQEGKRYHHILDTRTGKPVHNEVLGVTVLSKSSAEGDALSTTLFSLGIEAGLALVKELKDVEAAFVNTEGEMVLSEAARAVFEPKDSKLRMIVR